MIPIANKFLFSHRSLYLPAIYVNSEGTLLPMKEISHNFYRASELSPHIYPNLSLQLNSCVTYTNPAILFYLLFLARCLDSHQITERERIILCTISMVWLPCSRWQFLVSLHLHQNDLSQSWILTGTSCPAHTPLSESSTEYTKRGLAVLDVCLSLGVEKSLQH